MNSILGLLRTKTTVGRQAALLPVLLITTLAIAPELRIFSVAAIDRAVSKLELESEARAYQAQRSQATETGLPIYTAEVTVTGEPMRFGTEIRTYETLPHFGTGGRQGPSFDRHTGLPWWR